MKQKLYFVFVLAVIGLTACTTPPKGAPAVEAYLVNLSSADFISGVNNPYFPLSPGMKWVYEATLNNGTKERNELEVLHDTKVIMGITAVVVHDLVIDAQGQVIEETYDWYAQDKIGNVWYLGEAVDNYENGVIANHKGSWEWGADGALPGIIMWADPSAHLNEEYYQEFYAGEAEDKGKVQSVTESVDVPFGSFDKVVKTYDFSTADPNLKENKYYSSGIGIVREDDLSTGELVVLVEFTPTQP